MKTNGTSPLEDAALGVAPAVAGERKRRPGAPRGRRQQVEQPDNVRFFVGQPAEGEARPALDQEVGTEVEALILAYKTGNRLYLVHEFNAIEHVDGGQVRLQKEPAPLAKRVSTLNLS